MCGIAGAYGLRGNSVPTEIVREMGLKMVHRGPDNFGFHQDERVAMSHNRLKLLDLSDAANQPFSNDRYVLAYNGEIYNFKQIRKRLEAEYNIQFSTTSDTEVLFYSLIHDGIDKCLQQIQGMFAFAFFDMRDERLVLARDRLGIKPLYYFKKQDTLYWASEIKALAKSLDLMAEPIRTVLSVNNVAEKSNEYTLFKDLFSVKPGCYLKVETDGEIQNVNYYHVLDDFDQDQYNDLSGKPAAEVVSTFEKMFVESVESMLVADVPVGAFVSGGLDSSTISAIAAQSHPDINLFTVNVIGKYSEFSDVEILSKHLNKKVFEYRFEPQMMIRDWVEATYYYECPIVIHVNSIPFLNVARLARDSGIKAVLTGEGADEIFMGYPRLLTDRYNRLATFPVNAIKSLYKISPKLSSYLFPENGHSPISFVNNLAQGFRVQEVQEKADEKFRLLGKNSRRDQASTINMLTEHLVTLLYRNDRMGMMSSIEARFPFLSESIVKFAVNLPSKFKIGRSLRFHNYKHPFLVDKWILRKVAEKYLPKELARKKKNGFPMFGHKYLKISNGFFANGWIADALGLDNEVQKYLIESQDPYFLAKLASVEIFGRIYGHGDSLEAVKDHVSKYAEIMNGEQQTAGH